MKDYGDKITDKATVSKVLRSLNKRFDSIEKPPDLSNYVFDELMSSLQAQEDIVNASQVKGEEKEFQIKGVFF